MEPPVTREAEARAEQLLREAHIFRMRRQTDAAERLCRQALEICPDDVMGHELLGDLLLERGRLNEALETYQQAFEKHPERTSLEDKIARTVLRKFALDRERDDAEL